MWRIVLLIIAALATTMPVHAESKKPKGSRASQGDVQKQLDVARRDNFSPAERNMIRAVLIGQKQTAAPQQQHRNLPHGLQKKIARGQALPPGWQKKVTPGHSLDYHVYRQGESLPSWLLRRLPPPPVGSEILRIENKVVRLNSATRAILDVFDLTPAP
jgi:Ni/Co efflux regulator RcnB